MSDETYFVTADGRAMCRCYDCRCLVELMHGRKLNVEVGEGGKVVGVLCDKCHATLEKAKNVS
jgi:hypothetical protein